MALISALFAVFLFLIPSLGFSADSCSAVFTFPQGEQKLVSLNRYQLLIGEVPNLGSKVVSPLIQYPNYTLDQVEKAGTTWSLEHPLLIEVPLYRKTILDKIANRSIYLNSEDTYAPYQMVATRAAFFESYPDTKTPIENIRKKSIENGDEWAFISMDFLFKGRHHKLTSKAFTSRSSSVIHAKDVKLALEDLSDQAYAKFGAIQIPVTDFSFFHTHPGRIFSPLSREDISATYSLRTAIKMESTTFRVHAIGWSEKDYIYRKSFFGKSEGTIQDLREEIPYNDF